MKGYLDCTQFQKSNLEKIYTLIWFWTQPKKDLTKVHQTQLGIEYLLTFGFWNAYISACAVLKLFPEEDPVAEKKACKEIRLFLFSFFSNFSFALPDRDNQQGKINK